MLALQEPLAAWLAERGVEVVSDAARERRSGIFAFRPRDAEGAYRALHAAGVQCGLREGASRIAPHLYTTGDVVAAVIEILEREGAR